MPASDYPLKRLTRSLRMITNPKVRGAPLWTAHALSAFGRLFVTGVGWLVSRRPAFGILTPFHGHLVQQLRWRIRQTALVLQEQRLLQESSD
jgi:hypothetical protein